MDGWVLERLLRYCARPIFAGDRLRWLEGDEMLIYQLPKPRYDGQTLLRLTPMEFLDRIALLVPPPRRHRHRYHGVLTPNAPLRGLVTARAGLPVTGERAVSGEERAVTEEGIEPDSAPVVTPARGPPDFYLELDQSLAWEGDGTEPVPEFEYDQTVSW